MGLERQGGHVVFANDIDPLKRDMYTHQFADADEHFVLGDVHTIDYQAIPEVDIATASFPCTDLSLAGARKGLAGAHSSAFWGFVDAVEGMKVKPPLVMLENVTGFLTSHRGTDFRDAMLALNRLGYSVDPFILDAAWFVPQSRQRLFVVGTLNRHLTRTKEPSGQYRFFESSVRPKSVSEFILQNMDINWCLRTLPEPPSRTKNLDDILEDLPADSGEWWSKERAEYLLNQMSARHRAEADQRISAPDISYGTVFRRVRNSKSMAELRTDGIAGCLRTPKGGSGRQILVRFGKGEFRARLLNAKECARLMGADDFAINVSLNNALFGFGDAVCVDAIAWIAEWYIKPALNEMLSYAKCS